MWTEAADREGCRPGGREGGFALALVVLMLFAVGLAGAVGYQVIMAEARMALQSHESAQALAIARAGLQLYMGEQVGPLPDTVRYPMNDGEATVTARRLWNAFDVDGTPDRLYLITSVGSYSDPRYATTPAERTVHQYVVQRRLPLDRLGALVAADGAVTVEDAGGGFVSVDGRDDGSGTCEEVGGGGPSDQIAGIVTVGSAPTIERNGNVRGNPQSSTYVTYDELMAALDLRWDLVTDPDFPVDYQDTWPSSFPADSFYVVRWNNDLEADWQRRGQGVLIVQGRLTAKSLWNWDGVVLAREFTDGRTGFGIAVGWAVNGMLVTGLGDQATTSVTLKQNAQVLYRLCRTLQGGGELAHLEPLDATWWESY